MPVGPAPAMTTGASVARTWRFYSCRPPHRFSPALGDDQRDVVVLLVGAELANLVRRSNRASPAAAGRAAAAGPRRGALRRIRRLLVERFGHAVGVERRTGRPRPSRRSPIEQSQSANRPSTVPVLSRRSSVSSRAQQQAAQVPAVRVAQPLRAVVVLGEEERRVGALDRVLVEELVHRPAGTLRLLQRGRALAAQVGLEVRHQEGGRDSLPRDVADHEPEAFLAEVQEIVVVAADLASLDAQPGVLERARGRQRLREEPGLHLAWRSRARGRRGARLPASRPAARRCASTARLSSSKLTSAKELPSTSSKRVNTPPQIGPVRGGAAAIGRAPHRGRRT